VHDYPTLAVTRRNIDLRHPLADSAMRRARDYSTTLMHFAIAMDWEHGGYCGSLGWWWKVNEYLGSLSAQFSLSSETTIVHNLIDWVHFCGNEHWYTAITLYTFGSSRATATMAFLFLIASVFGALLFYVRCSTHQSPYQLTRYPGFRSHCLPPDIPSSCILSRPFPRKDHRHLSSILRLQRLPASSFPPCARAIWTLRASWT
jgi:hypothetical protein